MNQNTRHLRIPYLSPKVLFKRSRFWLAHWLIYMNPNSVKAQLAID